MVNDRQFIQLICANEITKFPPCSHAINPNNETCLVTCATWLLYTQFSFDPPLNQDTNVLTYLYMYIHTYIRVFTYLYTYVHTYVYKCTYLYMYICVAVMTRRCPHDKEAFTMGSLNSKCSRDSLERLNTSAVLSPLMVTSRLRHSSFLYGHQMMQ